LFHEEGQILLVSAPINYLGVIDWPKQGSREEKALTEITRAVVLSVRIRVPPIFPHRRAYPHIEIRIWVRKFRVGLDKCAGPKASRLLGDVHLEIGDSPR
jgi:hypothetical protein